tara:strand:- start:8 stop:322 length:315 start_codon:yes stop_codon:yes gene_type:complete
MKKVETGKFGCLYPNCHKRYKKTDALRKHANKCHPKWIYGKKPKEYSFYIPKEYNGTDYVTDYMTMVRYILSELDNGNIPTEMSHSPIDDLVELTRFGQGTELF